MVTAHGLNFTREDPTPHPPPASPIVLARIDTGDPAAIPGSKLLKIEAVGTPDEGNTLTAGQHTLVISAPNAPNGTQAAGTVTASGTGATQTYTFSLTGGGSGYYVPPTVTPGATPVAGVTFVATLEEPTSFAKFNEPHAVHSLTEAITFFGNEGGIYDYCKHAFSVVDTFIVCVRYDEISPTTPAQLQASRIAAEDALDEHNNTGHDPKLISVAYTGMPDGTAHPNSVHLEAIAEDMRAYVYTVTGQSPTMPIARASDYGDNNGHQRIIPVFQDFQTPDKDRIDGSTVMSTFHAELIADPRYGIQDTISNKVLSHVVRAIPDVSFRYVNNHSTEAAVLDAHNVVTAVLVDGHYRAWGSTTKTDIDGDPIRFVSFGMVVDEAVDRLTRLLEDMVDHGDTYTTPITAARVGTSLIGVMRHEGKLRTGSVESDEPRNTPEALGRGDVYLIFNINGYIYPRRINTRVNPTL